MSSPLAGLLVADFSRVLAGPLATMHLADLGATVVKVEHPSRGDDTRHWGPPWTPDSSAYFDCVNRTKYGLTLDLGDRDQRAAAVELARRADVVVENFKPGTLDRFDLDYESVAASNPRVVYCSISGFGAEAGADRPGYDFIAQAVGGLMSITGDPTGEPAKVGVALVDVLTGKDAVIGILAAIAHRERTGQGDHLQVNLLSSLLGGLVNQAASFLTTGISPGRIGNRHPSIAPYETLRCADATIAIACGNDSQFAALSACLDYPDLPTDPRFASNAARVHNRRDLIQLLEQRLAALPATEWERRLADVGVPVGLVGDIGSAIDRAEVLGLQPLVDLGEGHPRQVRHPVQYTHAQLAEPAASPTLGQHTADLRAWLTAREAPLRARRK